MKKILLTSILILTLTNLSSQVIYKELSIGMERAEVYKLLKAPQKDFYFNINSVTFKKIMPDFTKEKTLRGVYLQAGPNGYSSKKDKEYLNKEIIPSLKNYFIDNGYKLKFQISGDLTEAQKDKYTDIDGRGICYIFEKDNILYGINYRVQNLSGESFCFFYLIITIDEFELVYFDEQKPFYF